jgi:hypothetical protein
MLHLLTHNPVGHRVNVIADDVTPDPIGLQKRGAAPHERIAYPEALEVVGFVK